MGGEQEEQLRDDWEFFAEVIELGELWQLDATRGEFLQVRPKAANARARPVQLIHVVVVIAVAVAAVVIARVVVPRELRRALGRHAAVAHAAAPRPRRAAAAR